jgi:hypothetical protein
MECGEALSSENLLNQRKGTTPHKVDVEAPARPTERLDFYKQFQQVLALDNLRHGVAC